MIQNADKESLPTDISRPHTMTQKNSWTHLHGMIWISLVFFWPGALRLPFVHFPEVGFEWKIISQRMKKWARRCLLSLISNSLVESGAHHLQQQLTSGTLTIDSLIKLLNSSYPKSLKTVEYEIISSHDSSVYWSNLGSMGLTGQTAFSINKHLFPSWAISSKISSTKRSYGGNYLEIDTLHMHNLDTSFHDRVIRPVCLSPP